jgi:hypothetical protein
MTEESRFREPLAEIFVRSYQLSGEINEDKIRLSTKMS